MPDLPLDDVTLHYEIDGTGPPLLLLAGMLGDGSSWAPLVPLLEERFTLIRPDNRTTGRTAPWDAPTSVAQMTRDALALMDHLGYARFHIAGHSLGGLMAMDLAGLHPDRVTRAAVLASGRVRSPRTSAIFDALLAVRRAPQGEEMWLRALYPWVFRPNFFAVPGNVDAALAAARAYPFAQGLDAMAHQIEAFKDFRPQARVEDIVCPVLVVYAGQDVMIPPSLARPGFTQIGNLREAVIEDAGHSMVWDAPQEVAHHLSAFFSGD